MSYKTPRSSSIVCNARITLTSADTVQDVTFNYVDFGASYFQGSAPYTGFIVPVAGIYEFRISGWRCGGGDGTLRVISTRGVSVVYDQSWTATNNDCNIFHDHFFVPNCQAGDVVTFKMSQNNAGATVSSITDPTAQQQGNFVAIYWAQF